MAKYRIDRTEASNDGSGMILWDVFALGDTGEVAKHATISTPWAETQVAITPPNVLDKVLALLKKYFPATGWDEDSINDFVVANENASTVDVAVDTAVENAGGYPIELGV